MTRQYDRKYELRIENEVESLVVRDLRIRFELTKTLLGYPNRGRIVVFNLSEERIQRITQRFSSVRLFVGYGETLKQVYSANLLNYYKQREGQDSLFIMVASGASRQWRNDTFAKAYRENTPPSKIIRDAANSFTDVVEGQILENPDWTPTLNGSSYIGSSNQVMNELATEFNFDWAINDNQIDVIPRGQVAESTTLVRVTPRTGLIGSPTLTELGADFRILLNPDIVPGRELFMDSAFAELGQEGIDFRRVRNTADGRYKAMETRLVGDTRGQDWYTDIIGWRTGDEPRKDVE